MSDTVDALDLKAFHPRYEGDGRRRQPFDQPFDPSMTVKVLVYAYASGVFSSRKIASRLEKDGAFRVLGAGHFPARRTIREFRQLHLAAFSALFVQIVHLAREAGNAHERVLAPLVPGATVRQMENFLPVGDEKQSARHGIASRHAGHRVSRPCFGTAPHGQRPCV